MLRDFRIVLNHEQMVLQQVKVTASVPGIDTEQTSDKSTMNLPEIVSIPYTTSRDIRNLLPFYPGVIQDATGQVHVVGSETWATLDTLDGFDIRSPVSGILAMRVSADAVRSIDEEATRYPVEFGRSTGGVVAFYTGMGDNKFRFNATNFLPSFRDVNGIRFDKFVPRVTLSGPLVRNRAWFFDGVEAEYDNIYISELPSGGRHRSTAARKQPDQIPGECDARKHCVGRPAVQRLSFPIRRHLVLGAAAEHHKAQHHRMAAVSARPAELSQRGTAGCRAGRGALQRWLRAAWRAARSKSLRSFLMAATLRM